MTLPRAFHVLIPNLCSASYRVYSSHRTSPPSAESRTRLCADAKPAPKSIDSCATRAEEATRASLARPRLFRALSSLVSFREAARHPCSSDVSQFIDMSQE